MRHYTRSYFVTSNENRGNGATVYTQCTLSVEKMIKGDPNTKEIVFKKEGGFTKEILLYIPPYISISDKLLLCLNKGDDGIYQFRIDGMLWADGRIKTIDRSLQESICRVIKIMRQHKLPIALSSQEILCLPKP